MRGAKAAGLTLLVTAEVACQTFGWRHGNLPLVSVGYILLGLSVGVFGLLPQGAESVHSPSRSRYRWLAFGLFAGISLLALWRTPVIIQNWGFDYQIADMLPIIQTMGERFWAGEAVYAEIPEIWGGMYPIYLPAMWMPYLPAVGLGIDLRWANTLFYLLAAGLAAWPGRQWQARGLLLFLPLCLLTYFVFVHYTSLIGISEEPAVVLFYTLLGWSLLRRKAFRIGLAAALCLLSRYALAFWLLAWGLYQLAQKHWQLAGRAAAAALGAGLLLMGAGQAFAEIPEFLALPGKYLAELSDPEREWGVLQTVQRNLGLAKFVPYSGLPLLHRSLMPVSLLLPLGLFAARWRWPGAFSRAGLFELAVLKLSMLVFFNLLPTAYSYLFYTSSFLSLLLLRAFLLPAARSSIDPGHSSNSSPY